MNGLAVVALCVGALSLLRYAIALPMLSRWLRRGRVSAIPKGNTPPLTLLKPLYGSRPELAADLEATLRQNYPDFEVLFVHEREDDPALAAVAGATHAVPDVPVRTIAGRDADATNPKVAVLARGAAAARPESTIIASADCDVRPDPLYLRDIANGLADADAVSFVPVLFDARGWMGGLAALAVNTDALLGIVMARGVAMTGSTIGIRRDALEAVGGWAAVGDRIADDYAMGRALRRAGKRTALARRAVRVRSDHGSAADTTRWMLRWGRTVRVSAPLPYAFAIVLASAPVLLILARGLHHTPGALWMLAGITLARAGTGLAIELRYVWDGSTRRALLALPLLWILEPLGLLLGLFGSRVEWRGRRYRLNGDRATLDPQ
jgi:ceramide glucosyltransferase